MPVLRSNRSVVTGPLVMGLLFYLLLEASTKTTVQLAAFSVSLAASVIVFRTAFSSSELGLLSPLGLVGLAHGTSFTLPAAIVDFEEIPSPAPANYPLAVLAGALVVTIAAFVARSSGRSRAPRRRVGSSNLAIAAVWFATLLLGLLSLALSAQSLGGGAAGFAAALGNRRVAFSGQVWRTWGLLAPAASAQVIWLLREVSPRPILNTLAWPAAIAGGLFALANGNRASLVAMTVVLIATRWSYRRPWTIAKQFLGAVVAIVVVLSLLTIIRTGSVNAELQLVSPLEGFEEIETNGAVSTFGQLPAAAWLFEGDRRVGPLLGASYLAAVTQGIPRSIAPWKLRGIGERVTREYNPGLWAAGTGVQVSAAGEAYANFGWAGIGLAGIAIGLFVRFVEKNRSLTGIGGSTSQVVSLSLVPRSALLIRGEFASVAGLYLMEMVILVVVWFAMTSLLATRRPTGNAESNSCLIAA